ncbi:hypothetical protein [Nocardioides sp. CER19]|uniref:hypothetical protein n=1 Tax=Nocardioides sp. CER19 TaxID=3038538 RepID=UPI00244CD99D|nr:hypothetical protein [Nocardioides sp. CER19]MDH2413813.1 hypothetical protein [Nocardioides sp. CER19]
MTTTNDLCDRYVAVWNEADPTERRAQVAALWTPDAEHLLVPPEEVRDSAAGMAMHPLFEVRGHQELERRVADAYGRFVASGEYGFRRHDDPDRLRDMVKFRWAMVSATDAAVAAVGLEILLVDAEGRIRTDYQFIERS